MKTYSFNVDFVNKKLPSFSTASPVRHQDMSDSQHQRTHKQRHLRRRKPIATTAEHIRRLNRHKQQRNHRTNRRNSQIRPP
ncbi:hypothetical protein HanRHA438_Chr14g0678231 [Helianthus annuus]|nr:hypothetical protein HanRHA438_Chr14g0678231 [Helianthus annuus]